MDITTYYPRHTVLQQYIDYYYFLKAESPDFNTTYYAFPNIVVPLSLHKSATCAIKPHYTGVQAVKNGHPAALIQRSYQEPLLVNLKGPINKVTICFKPLAISSFIAQPFSEIAPEDSQLFRAWEQYPAYHRLLPIFFDMDDPEARIALLEEFLISVYNPAKELQLVQQAINSLSDFTENSSMDEIAAMLELNTRSFNRLFYKHMSIAPVAWKKIARFRHSLQNKLFNARFKKLTEIGYASNFYDQAYFIKVYNKLTGSNPTAFFRSVEKLADDRLVFKFVKE